jgi:hypothetical protein
VTARWGCWNTPRKDGYWASAMTYTDNRRRRMQAAIWIEDKGSKDCQHRKGTPNDPKCAGCRK